MSDEPISSRQAAIQRDRALRKLARQLGSAKIETDRERNHSFLHFTGIEDEETRAQIMETALLAGIHLTKDHGGFKMTHQKDIERLTMDGGLTYPGSEWVEKYLSMRAKLLDKDPGRGR